MSFDFSLLLDIVIVVLLGATIVYATILNRQLTQLRDSRSELEALVRGFAEATQRAETGVKNMKKTAAESGEALQRAIEKAQALHDELHLMIEAADNLASRLENSVGNERGRGAAPPMPATSAPPRPAAQPLRPPPPRPAVTPAQPLRPPAAVMEESPKLAAPVPTAVSGPAAPAETPDPAPMVAEGMRADPPRRPPELDDLDLDEPAESPRSREPQDALSRAERELLQAIESMR